jgi:hydrogenase maturation protein HypF
MHIPDFSQHRKVSSFLKKWNVELLKVQHHRAHFAAVMGENNLFKPEENVLGFIWDGVGLGDDKNIWGGELFSYSDNIIERLDHIPYFKYFLGDKMSREPRLSALALLDSYGLSTDILKNHFEEKEWKIYHTLLGKYDGVMTSSMGRVFDAVASLVLGIEKQTYEGEAAMMLEAKATKYYMKNGHQLKSNRIKPTNDFISIISGVVADSEEDIERRAFQFHVDLVGFMMGSIRSLGAIRIAFSGGVFQNRLLTDLIIDHLADDYQLIWHQQLSPNDENISFGQLMHHLYDIKHT